MTTSRPSSRPLPLFLLCLAVLLLGFFSKSFSPDYLLASNDGPYGAANQHSLAMPGALAGVWFDLNSIGFSGGSYSLTPTSGLLWLLGPLGFSKFYVPLVLLFVGCSAWIFFRCLGLSRLACLLGGLAAALNSGTFSTACWGVGPQVICLGLNYLALAALVSNPARLAALKFILAGFAVGLAVMEGADVGALLSLLVAAFVFYSSLTEEGSPLIKTARGLGRVAVLAMMAAFMAAQALTVLIGTQIKGVAGMAQDTKTKADRWDFATQWSLPKREVLGLIVPGLFGYRMDTPRDISRFATWFEGGNYWGAVGRDPAWDRYFAGGAKGEAPNPNRQFIRYSGGGGYEGVLVALIALWAALQSLRKANSVLASRHRKLVWFWAGAAVVSLLLAFGRHAPFYQMLYALPYFSTIRNPAKFLTLFNWAIVILFAHGIHGLSERYLLNPAAKAGAAGQRLRSWWLKAGAFDRRWLMGCLAAIAVSVVGWLIYASSRQSLENYLDTVSLGQFDPKAVAAFSIRQVGWFILFLGTSTGLMLLVLSGKFAGDGARWGGALLGLMLVTDLGRAALPWVIHWNYKQKYASNPIIDFLKVKPYEHRVAILPFPVPPQFSLLGTLYDIEWKQHHFQCYNVQSPDVVQMPRVAQDLMAYNAVTELAGPSRKWELTNTRYLLGPAVWPIDERRWTPFVDVLNQQLDPGRQRFRVVTSFELAPKPGLASATRLEELTAVPSTNGRYALFEYTGALPRAKLYSHWRVSTNDPVAVQQWVKSLQPRLPQDWANALAGLSPDDQATLKDLASDLFVPAETVLLAEPLPISPAPGATNSVAGTVEYSSYAPKHIVLKAHVETPSVLLLNDKYDPDWKVKVDGKSADLLRCNFIMRGVYLTPGTHTIEFSFHWPMKPLYVSLAAIVVGLLVLGILLASNALAESSPDSAKNEAKESRKESAARGSARRDAA